MESLSSTPAFPSAPHATYALVLAGGSGQRFWPVSRDRLPKQLLALFGGKTLLEHTIDRLDGVVPRENILVLTNQQQLDSVCEVLKDFPREQILAEPEKRDTAPAITLGIGWVAARDPQATMMVLPSDHWIQDKEEFHRAVRTALAAAQQSQALVTIGIKPTWPCPSYGYVEQGAPFSTPGTVAVHEVTRFREKPKQEVAAQYLEQGNFVWNAGMFFWSVAAVRRDLGFHCAELAGFIDALECSSDFAATVQQEFPTLPKVSIDYALMEKAGRVLNVEATFDWDDVGNWTSMASYLTEDEGGNRYNCRELSQHEAGNNLVFTQTGHHVALLGVQDLMVISTPDALLVAHRSQAEQLKKLVERLPAALR